MFIWPDPEFRRRATNSHPRPLDPSTPAHPVWLAAAASACAFGVMSAVFAWSGLRRRTDWTLFFVIGLGSSCLGVLTTLTLHPEQRPAVLNLARVLATGLSLWALTAGVVRVVDFGSRWMQRMFAWASFAVASVAILSVADGAVALKGAMAVLVFFGLVWSALFLWGVRHRPGHGHGASLAAALGMVVMSTLGWAGQLPEILVHLPAVLPICAMALAVLRTQSLGLHTPSPPPVRQ